jgi:hypothetical protein
VGGRDSPLTDAGEPAQVFPAADAGTRSRRANPADADALRRAFKRDLKAGMLAVRRGLVQPEDALERLRRSYPQFTRSLRARDLIT